MSSVSESPSSDVKFKLSLELVFVHHSWQDMHRFKEGTEQTHIALSHPFFGFLCNFLASSSSI